MKYFKQITFVLIICTNLKLVFGGINDLKVVEILLTDEMKTRAIDVAYDLLINNASYSEISNHLVNDFNSIYGKEWFCIVLEGTANGASTLKSVSNSYIWLSYNLTQIKLFRLQSSSAVNCTNDRRTNITELITKARTSKPQVTYSYGFNTTMINTLVEMINKTIARDIHDCDYDVFDDQLNCYYGYMFDLIVNKLKDRYPSINWGVAVGEVNTYAIEWYGMTDYSVLVRIGDIRVAIFIANPETNTIIFHK